VILLRIGLLTLLSGMAFNAQAALVVCADPNNLPFSDHHEAGFENKLAQLLARELHTDVKYEWWAQRRGFARQTLNESRCDLWPGVAAGLQSMATSAPYYTSTYVFVTRESQSLAHLSLDDPRLRELRIGVQLIGDDGMNTPPASALASRGITQNVRGYTLYGDYRRPDPPAAILDALVKGSVNVALVWGPLAGFYARHSSVPLRLEPIIPGERDTAPMSFPIAVGIRRNEPQLLDRINRALHDVAPAIGRLLQAYGVPLAARPVEAPHSEP
jgi:mxaJ protein